MSRYSVHGIYIIIPVLALFGCNLGLSSSIKSEVTRASELIEQKKFDEASKILTQVTEADPRDAVALYYAGALAFAQHDYKVAVDKLSESLIVAPYYAPSYSLRGLAYTRLGDNTNALVDLNQAVRLAPEVAKNYHRRAIIHLNMKEYAPALADIEKTQALDPKETPFFVLMNRAESYFGLKQYSKAIADYGLALKIAPAGNSDAYLRRALARGRSDDFKGAQQDCTEYLKRYPEDPEAHALQGALYSIADQYPKATHEYLQALKGSPIRIADLADFGGDHPAATCTLVDVCLKKNLAQLAVAILTGVESHRPLEPQEMYRLALANFAMKRQDRAISLLNSAIAMSPDYIDPRVELIRFYSGSGLTHKALDLQREAYAVAKSQCDRDSVAAAMLRRR